MESKLTRVKWTAPACVSRILLALVVLACSMPVQAQSTGAISGAVTDQQGAAMPGVAIVVKHVQTGVTRELVTNEAGRYNADLLPVGAYEVTAQLSGFQTAVRSGIELTLGRNAVVDVSLAIGGLQEVVTVAGDVSQVETTTPTVSNLITERMVLDIPLNNRDLTQLTYFTPGVLRVPLTPGGGTFANTATGGAGDKLSVNGARAQQNLYLLNGIPNSDASGNPQAVSGAYSGAESVREFQVITNSYSAEHPSVAGAIISAVTKSGTNTIHGSAFGFFRDDSLDAAKWEDNAFGRPKPDFNRKQFGGAFGGPLVKDRTFFFASYEGLRENRSVTSTFTTITEGPRNGSLGPVHPDVAPYLALWPLPGQGGTTLIQDFGDGRALVASTARRPLRDDYVSFKLDHQFANQRKGNLAFYLLRDVGKAENFDGFEASGANIGQKSKSSMVSAQHTSVLSSSTLNEFLAGYSTTKPEGGIAISPVDFTNFNGRDLRFGPDTPVMGALTISNVASVGFAGGPSAPGHNVLILKNGALLTRGNHTIKVGGQVNHSMDPMYTSTNFTNGSWSFTSLRNFIANRPTSLTVNLPDGTMVLGLPVQTDPLFDLRQWTLAGYAQDNWAVKPSFTLTGGLRYEFSTNFDETRGHLWSLRDFFSSTPTQGPLHVNATKKNLSPRLGFAWAPGADRKTSIRGGVGIYYEPPSLFSTQFNLAQSVPHAVTGAATDPTATGALDFPDAYVTQPQLLASAPLGRLMEYDMQSATIYRWSVTVDREIGAWLLSAGYTGSRSRDLLLQFEANMNKWDGYPAEVPTFEKHFSLSNGLINPEFGRYTISSPRGKASYEGLTLNVKRQVGGWQFQGAYTLSEARDMGASSVNLQDSLAQSVRTSYYWEDTKILEGPSLFDIRQNFVANMTYDLPTTARGGLAGALANGWQLTGVLMLSDGFAFSLSDSGNAAQRAAMFSLDALRPNLIPGGNPSPILGGPDMYYDVTQFVPSTCTGARVCSPGDPDYRTGYFGNLPYNSLVGPGYATLDASIVRNVKVGGERRVQFRAEFFNVTNRANFALPNTAPFLANGQRNPEAGKITQTRGTARQIQIGLKYLF